MKIRFIDFEGIHGSGKSTYAWKLFQQVNEIEHAEVHFEYFADSIIENPCDIRMTAVMDSNEFKDLLDKNVNSRSVLLEKVRVYGGFNCIFIPDFNKDENVVSMLRCYIADDGNVSKVKFIEALKGKVKAFVENALMNNKIYIFENVIFQQLFNEFMRSLSCTAEEMIQHVNEILEILSPLNPTIFYLNPIDLKAQIEKIAMERVSDNYDLYPDWIDWMVEYLKKSKYGMLKNVQSRDDLMVYFQERYSLEQKCFEQLKIHNKYLLKIDGENYDTNEKLIYKLSLQSLDCRCN